MAPSFSIRVNENTTFRYSGIMRDENGVVLAPTDLTSLSMDLYDQDSGVAINGRTNQNILNTNQWTMDVNGNLVWSSLPADSPILDDSKETEVHIAVLKWMYSSGIKEGTKEIAIRVVNLERIPT